jgi:hypothetical protein
MVRRRERIRLIDDRAFLVQRQKVHSPKPDGWLRSPKHLSYVRDLRCACCGEDAFNEAAHVRKGTDGGTGQKPSDYFTLPLTRYCHAVQHQIGEVRFWEKAGIPDPIQRALEIAMQSPCEKTRSAAIEEHKRRYG